jgi:hypothetical protein
MPGNNLVLMPIDTCESMCLKSNRQDHQDSRTMTGPHNSDPKKIAVQSPVDKLRAVSALSGSGGNSI